MKYFIPLLSLLLITNTAYSGGPWVKKKGEAYFQLGGGIIPSTNMFFFNGSDILYTNRPVTDMNLGLYTEYGLTNKLTFITEIPFNIVSTGSSIDTLTIFSFIKPRYVSRVWKH